MWFKIYQANGKPTMHDARFIAGLVIIAKEDALGDMLHRPVPIVIPTIPERMPRLVATKQDIADRSGATIPGMRSGIVGMTTGTGMCNRSPSASSAEMITSPAMRRASCMVGLPSA